MTSYTNHVDFRKISSAEIFISEPEPAWFGNDPNEPQNPNWTNSNWLKSRFHFSFAEWSGGRTRMGSLRVVNDDLIQPSRGFGTHGHRDMEIITYILKGGLTHQDSMGTEETLGRGSIQYMTAGTGVMHSEKNLSSNQELRLIQSWILPKSKGLNPRYGSFQGNNGNGNQRLNRWHHLVSDIGQNGQVQINQDFNLFVSEIDTQKSLSFELSQGRQAYAVCLEGSLKIKSMLLERHEACEIRGGNEPVRINFYGQKGEEKTHVLLYEMKD